MVPIISTREDPFRRSDTVSKIGMRLSELDFTRATEQIAILNSRFACMKERRGVSNLVDQQEHRKRNQFVPIQRNKAKRQLARLVEKNAFGLLLGYIEDTQGCTRIVHSGPYVKGNYDLLKHGNIFGRDKLTPSAEWYLDMVSSPTDGLFDMIAGRDHGAVSAIGCGPKGTFALPGPRSLKASRWSLTHYFTVVRGPDMSPVNVFPKFLHSKSETGLDELVIKKDLVQKLERPKKSRIGRSRLTINTMRIAEVATSQDFEMSRLVAALRPDAKVRTRYGSSIVAALSAILPRSGVDAFVGVMNPTQTLIIAAATLASKGQMWAIPVFFTKKRGDCFRIPPVRLKVLCAEDFVQNNDMFVVITGITGDTIPKGIRFPDDNSVDTETLCLRILTKSRRIINHRHELRERWIRFVGEPLHKDDSHRSLATLYPRAVEYFDEHGSWVGK